MKKFIKVILAMVFIQLSNTIAGQETKDIFEMSLEELMNIPVSVASKTEMTPRESPGIISVITKDEILNSGARDLIDVLRMIPGFEFGCDVQGVVGLGLRGIWGHEGKILIMIDGFEMNELNFTTNPVGNHYPVDQIKRVEIIRGPGSAIYGGFAELGVINIITKSAEDINGITASTTAGINTGNFSRSNLSVSVGKKINDNLSFNIHSWSGNAIRSEKKYTDINQSTYDMENQSEMNTQMVNASVVYKELNTKFLYDNYIITTRDMLGENFLRAYPMHFRSLMGEVAYKWKVTEKVTLTPKYSYKENEPYHIAVEPVENENEIFDIINDNSRIIRHLGNITGDYKHSDKLNFLIGGEFIKDFARTYQNDSLLFYYTGKNKINFSNMCFFAQGNFISKYLNITVGGRVENHSQTGFAYAPRISFTKSFDKFHYKLLYSQAFRSPSVKNIDLNAYFDTINFLPHINPEKTNVIEIESGLKLGKNIYLTANAFQVKIKDVIVYFVDEDSGREGYKNGNQTGSRGFEIEGRYSSKTISFTSNYSFSTPDGLNKVADYEIPGNKKVLLGFPQHKFNLITKLNITSQISATVSFNWLSERYAFRVVDSVNVSYDKNDPVLLANIAFNYRNFLIENLHLQVAMYNCFDADYRFIQPYNGGHNPLPALGRELLVKIGYNL